MSDKMIGKTLAGRFVLGEMLGTGATGAVYKAQQTSVDRVVAVKLLHPFLQQREDFKARFEIEAKAVARLNHPNCITLYDFGYDEDFDVFYMAVEYIKGEALADLMDEPIPSDDILFIAYQVADALQHAHKEGILHRDLKPENIMIQRDAESGRQLVKVLDFGLARLYETNLDDDTDEPASGRYKQITEAGQVYGTPAYMSPEQCRGHADLTPATDLYALGTMMYELLAQELPFFSRSTAELIMMQMTDDPPELERIDLPDEVKRLVHSMMAKDPAARPQSAKEVLVTLLPHVRLDASQEFRIVPGNSRELARLTVEQAAAISQSGPLPSVVPESPTTLDLSDDELRSARTSRKTLILFGVIAVLVGFLAAVVLVSLNGDGAVEAAPVVRVDSPPAVGADSTLQESEGSADGKGTGENFAVADNGEEPTPKKRKKAPKSKPKSKAKSEPARDANRPKTLKLTY